MTFTGFDLQAHKALAQSPLPWWVASYSVTSDGCLVFVHKRRDGDQSEEGSIFYRLGSAQPSCVELVITEELIEEANDGIYEFCFAIVSLLSWLGDLTPETAWAKSFPIDDVLVVREPAGKSWEHTGACMYYQDS